MGRLKIEETFQTDERQKKLFQIFKFNFNGESGSKNGNKSQSLKQFVPKLPNKSDGIVWPDRLLWLVL